MSTPANNLMTVPEFSAHLGFGRTYAYQLQKEGRLVMSEDGKRVLVAESMARIETTKDPARQGVAARHAVARETKTTRSPEPEAGEPEPPEDEAPAGPGPTSFDFQGSKAKREHFAALEAEASYREKVRELLPASEVRAVMTETMTVLRRALEGIAHRLAPALAAEVQEHEVRAMLDTEIRAALETAATELAAAAK
ncbi:MAG: hypothetical protein ACT6S0_25545 [Roseateles sp.]|uniref:hypothetical protein n=1 Tax=Roseateles sp. TaxID=1971397 RepID=UPI004035D227